MGLPHGYEGGLEGNRGIRITGSIPLPFMGTALPRDLQPEVRRGAQGRAFVTEADRWGAIWRDHQNAYFREHGITTRVDPVAVHSGPNVGPVRFRGPAGMETEADAAKLAARNAEAARDPAKVIEALTKRNATFTSGEIERLLTKSGIEGKERRELKVKALAQPGVIKLFDGEGQAVGRFTTTEVRRHELGIMADAEAVAESRHRDLNIEPGRDLHEDQRRAFDYAVAGRGVVVIEGRAGTGKSYTLAAIRDVHESAGYQVHGLAPTNEVARALRKDGFRHAATLHSELYALKHGRAKWDRNTLLIVDEAAMADAKITGELLAEARKAGSKLIFAGDDRQLASIERGGLFRELADKHGSVEITGVVRQRGWQKDASEDMAAGAWARAVKAFNDHGAIRWTEGDAKAKAALVAAWAADSKAQPGTDRFVFAYTNRDVEELHRELREVRIDRGELGEGREFLTKHGKAEFSVGDRVQFTGTLKSAGINNGTVGTITDVGKGRLAAQMDDGQVVQWKPSEFHAFRHGYCGTIYRGQGRTITSTYLYHSKHWHSTGSYVALSRQTESSQVFVSRQSAVDVATLAQQMGRTEERGASIRWHTIEDVPRLQAAVAANDQDVVKAQGTAAMLFRSAYRDTATAAERLSALVERDGWQEAAAQVSADPAILGQLAGRDGFLAGARSRGDRLEALQSIDRAITWIDRLPALTDQAIERRQQEKA
jgi:hypothetical protein